MVSEGTYPHGHGGVSVWCDQLVRGMPEHEFELLALTATGLEPVAWEIPKNVSGVHSVALWGTPPRRIPMKHAIWLRRAHRERAAGAVHDLGMSLTEPDLVIARKQFAAALRAWSELAPTVDIEAQLVTSEFLDLLLRRWTSDLLAVRWGGRSHGYPTVADALVGTRLLTHALRPLMVVPPKVDLTHLVANGLAGLVGLAAKWRHNTPYILSEHGIYLRERYLSFGGSQYSWPVKWLMLRFYRLLTNLVYGEAVLVAPGNVYNRRWELWDGVPIDAIRTVYNGVDPNEFEVAPEEPATPTVAFVGRIDPIKDLETLIRGFAVTHALVPEARLRIFGGTPPGGQWYADLLARLVDELQLTEYVTFEGRIARIQDAYAAGSLVALTSISEGFPYTVIEAMSCGRPTVSTDVGGVAEAVGAAGMLVPPRQPEAFGRACAELLRDEHRRRQLARLARERVTQLFTLERSIEAFRELYEDGARAHLDVVSAA